MDEAAVVRVAAGLTPPAGCTNLTSGGNFYQDSLITIDIPLPSNYSTVYGGKVWWKVRYNVGSSATDRTTWSVNIVGDPVHLLN